MDLHCTLYVYSGTSLLLSPMGWESVAVIERWLLIEMHGIFIVAELVGCNNELTALQSARFHCIYHQWNVACG